MSVTIDGITFDNVAYDPVGDVLYLHVGDPRTAVAFDESPEGHAIRLDAGGRVVGITLLRPRHLLDHGEPVAVTMPARRPVAVDPATINSALHAA
jgi:uncharacterized protein YuzE